MNEILRDVRFGTLLTSANLLLACFVVYSSFSDIPEGWTNSGPKGLYLYIIILSIITLGMLYRSRFASLVSMIYVPGWLIHNHLTFNNFSTLTVILASVFFIVLFRSTVAMYKLRNEQLVA